MTRKTLFLPSSNARFQDQRSQRMRESSHPVCFRVVERQQELAQLKPWTVCSRNWQEVFQVCSGCSTVLAGAQVSRCSPSLSDSAIAFMQDTCSFHSRSPSPGILVSGRKKKRRKKILKSYQLRFWILVL